MIVRLVEAGDFHAYPDALRFIIAAKDAGVRVAAASSSKNAKLFLRRIRLDESADRDGIASPTVHSGLTLLGYFDADVSGRDFARGKPDPEIFLTATQELGVAPERGIVLEDADQLAAAGADIVVTTLDDVDRPALHEGRLTTRE